MTLEEKQELIKSATTEEELEARMKQIEEDKEELEENSTEEVEEKIEEKSDEISKEEERKLIADIEDLETRSVKTSKLTKIGGNEEMEKKFTTASPEYRSAWAKKLMGVKLDETEDRAIGDAIGTTATTFVEADAVIIAVISSSAFTRYLNI